MSESSIYRKIAPLEIRAMAANQKWSDKIQKWLHVWASLRSVPCTKHTFTRNPFPKNLAPSLVLVSVSLFLFVSPWTGLMFKRVSSRLNCSWTTNRDVEDSGETKKMMSSTWMKKQRWRHSQAQNRIPSNELRKLQEVFAYTHMGLTRMRLCNLSSRYPDLLVFSPSHGDTLGSDQHSLAKRPTANAISKGGPTWRQSELFFGLPHTVEDSQNRCDSSPKFWNEYYHLAPSKKANVFNDEH